MSGKKKYKYLKEKSVYAVAASWANSRPCLEDVVCHKIKQKYLISFKFQKSQNSRNRDCKGGEGPHRLEHRVSIPSLHLPNFLFLIIINQPQILRMWC